MAEKLLNVEEVAEYLNVRPSTIYQWTHQGYIPHIKFGNLVRFKLSAIDAWLEKKTVSGRSTKKQPILT